MTNKYAGTCTECGGVVGVGKGELSKQFDNYKDEVVWVVRHSDKSICQRAKAEQADADNKAQAINDGLAWIKRHGKKINDAQDGNAIIYDGRKGYNQVGWLLTRADNTLYLTSRNSLDGVRCDETYIVDTTPEKIENLLWTMCLI